MLRKVFSLFAVAAVACVAFLVAPTTAAFASTILCTTSRTVDYQGKQFLIPTTSSGSQNCDLFQGDGPDQAVRVLQDSIDLCFIDPGYLVPYHITQDLDNDGIFGPLTFAALVATQKYLTIGHDGGYGPQTRAAMHWFDYLHDSGCFTVP